MKLLHNIRMFALTLTIFAALFSTTTAHAEIPENWTPSWVVDHQYAKVAVVDKIDEENDTVYFLINFGDDGYWYTMEGIEDLFVGDICGLLMNDNGTPEIFDDIILSATYSGWTTEDFNI